MVFSVSLRLKKTERTLPTLVKECHYVCFCATTAKMKRICFISVLPLKPFCLARKLLFPQLYNAFHLPSIAHKPASKCAAKPNRPGDMDAELIEYPRLVVIFAGLDRTELIWVSTLT